MRLELHPNYVIKLGLLDDANYADLFPGSTTRLGGIPSAHEYAQLWFDGQVIAEGTRNNYRGALNLY